MKTALCSIIMALLVASVGCASAVQNKATDAAPDEGSKLRLVQLQIPEHPSWSLKSGFLMFITDPAWVLLDGSSYSSPAKPELFLETYCRAGATEGVVRFRLPEELSGDTWAKLSLGLHYDKPSERPRNIWDAWFFPDYQLPSGLDQSKLAYSFVGQEETLKPRITVGSESLDASVRRLNGVFTGAQFFLEGLSAPDRPTFAGFHLISFKPVNSLDAELGSLPIFKEIPKASGLFAVSVGLDRDPADRHQDDTYSATFVIGDGEARIAPDGTLTAAMSVDVVPVEVLARESLRDRFVDIWATCPFRHDSNVTPLMSCNVRASGAQPARLYFQRGVPFQLEVFDARGERLTWMMVPVERPEKIVVDLRKVIYAYTGFDSSRVEKKSNDRP